MGLPEGLTGRLQTRWLGRELLWEQQLDSTNLRALELSRAALRHGLVVGAELQTAGRGREGRCWTSPAGRGLTFSVTLDPRGASLPSLAQATLGAAVAVCETLHAQGLRRAHIKWPNDILVERSKLCGILCETRARDGRAEVLVVGIGLNVNQRAEELPEGASSCYLELGREVSRWELLAELLNRLEPVWELAVGGGLDQLLERWRRLSRWHSGHPLRVRQAGRWLSGVSDGLERDGQLRVKLDDGGQLLLASGGVEFL